MRDGGALVFVDSDEVPSEGQSGNVYWNGRGSGGEEFILDYCEENAERLRAKYGAWIHDLGETRFRGKRLVEHLALEDGLSYWWTTLLVEKSMWKSPAIHHAIRLLAAEEIILTRKPSAVRLISDDSRIHASFRAMCAGIGVRYSREKSAGGLSSSRREESRRHLSHVVRGAVTLARYAGARWPFRRAVRVRWFGGEQALFFGSLFFNLDSAAAGAGRFHSHFWNGLHEVIRKLGLHGTWLHIFIPHEMVGTPERALGLARDFNRDTGENGAHLFLDGFLSAAVLRRIVAKWFALIGVSLRLGSLRGAFSPKDSSVCFWPLLADDWYSSTRGSVAVNNLLWLELYDEALRGAPRQHRGLYLCENHSWERGLVHSWKKHGHGELIAVPHSTRSFWDLRFYQDARTYDSSLPYPMPQPDLTAVNGQAARDAYLGENYPPERVINVEALRYIYLNDLMGRHPTRQRGETARLLVLGDYLPATTRRMMRLLESAVSHLGARPEVTVKPHPHFIVDPADFPSLDLRVVHEPLAELLPRFDIALASGTTSASVDSYLAGVPTIVMVEHDRLNLSPLWRRPGARFVTTPRQLADAIAVPPDTEAGGEARDDFFFLDPALPRWRSAISTSRSAVDQ